MLDTNVLLAATETVVTINLEDFTGFARQVRLIGLGTAGLA